MKRPSLKEAKLVDTEEAGSHYFISDFKWGTKALLLLCGMCLVL